MHVPHCSARAAANRITRIVQKRVRMKMSAQLYQNDCLLIILDFVGGEYYREKRYCMPCAYNNFQNQTAAEIKLEFIIHFIHKYVCMCVQKRRLNRVFLSDRKVINTPALSCINLGQ